MIALFFCSALAGGITLSGTPAPATSIACGDTLSLTWKFDSKPAADAKVELVLRQQQTFFDTDVIKIGKFDASAASASVALPSPFDPIANVYVYIYVIGSGAFGLFATDGLSLPFAITCAGVSTTAPTSTAAPPTLPPMTKEGITITKIPAYLRCDYSSVLDVVKWTVKDLSAWKAGDKIVVELVQETTNTVLKTYPPVDYMLNLNASLTEGTVPRNWLAHRIYFRAFKSGDPLTVSIPPTTEDLFSKIVCGLPAVSTNIDSLVDVNCGDQLGVALYYNFAENDNVLSSGTKITVTIWVDAPGLFVKDFVYEAKDVTYPSENYVTFYMPKPVPSTWGSFPEFYFRLTTGSVRDEALFEEDSFFDKILTCVDKPAKTAPAVAPTQEPAKTRPLTTTRPSNTPDGKGSVNVTVESSLTCTDTTNGFVILSKIAAAAQCVESKEPACSIVAPNNCNCWKLGRECIEQQRCDVGDKWRNGCKQTCDASVCASATTIISIAAVVVASILALW